MKAIKWIKGLFYFVTGAYKGFEDDQCPWCGDWHCYDSWDFTPSESGESYGPEHTTYWTEGTAKCWECGYQWQQTVTSD